jgi:DNA-binding transcriptional regulator GbsR (MarR family)
MEQETLYTAAKWDILKSLSESKKAPIELAEQTNTSLSNISQSLRFLEVAGLVKSERISNRDKGQPRVVYSLSKDMAYLIITTQGFAEKKQIDLDIRKKILLKIWLFENLKIQKFLEKAIENLEDNLQDFEGILLDRSNLVDIKIILIPKEGFKKEFKPFSYDYKSVTKKIIYTVSEWGALESDSEYYYEIHDPFSIMRVNKQNE